MVDAHSDKGEEKSSAEADLISLLHSKLPQYIVNCFITTGYDTVAVIKDIDDQKLNDMEHSLANIFLRMPNIFTWIMINVCFHLVID